MSLSPSSVPPIAPGLRAWRRHRDLTQSQLAAAVGVHQATISDWEHQRGQPRLDQARTLARVLGAPSVDLLFPDGTGAAA